MGSLELMFLQSRESTGGSLDLFEMTLQPGARMPVPHYHESWDETVYGLAGVSLWRVDGRDIELRPGQTLFIRRGVVHGFDNRERYRRRAFACLRRACWVPPTSARSPACSRGRARPGAG